MFELKVSKTKIAILRSDALTSGMVGQKVHVSFSPEWSDLNITAVFNNGKNIIDIINPLEVFTIPPEILSIPNSTVEVGFYGFTIENGIVKIAIPTVYARLGVVAKGAEPSGAESAEVTPSVAEQLQNEINTMDQRVDELEQHGGGGGWTDEQIDLLEAVFGYIEYTDIRGKQIAAELIASLRGEEQTLYGVVDGEILELLGTALVEVEGATMTLPELATIFVLNETLNI